MLVNYEAFTVWNYGYTCRLHMHGNLESDYVLYHWNSNYLHWNVLPFSLF